MKQVAISLIMVFALVSLAEAAPKLCGHAQVRSLPASRLVKWTGPIAQGRGFPTVGEGRELWTYDLSVMPPANVSISSTCRGVGQRGVIWVADDQWGSAVTQETVDTLLGAMEGGTPRTPDSGIIANNAALFGDPPLFAQGDPDLTLFLYDIPDYGNYHFDGFFRAEDLQPFSPACVGNPMNYCSNEMGMVHVDSVNAASEYMQGVIAHEYEHLAHYGADTFEENWLDESLAELAMVYSGYEDKGNLNYFLAHPESSLVVEPPVDYGACYLFGSYLLQRLGMEGINSLVASPLKGIASIEAHLDEDTDFARFFGQWTVANILDRPDLADGQYGHDLVEVPGFKTVAIASMPAQVSAQLNPTTGAYHVFGGTGDAEKALELSFDPGSSAAVAHLVVPETGRVSWLKPGDLVKLGAIDAQFETYFVFANPDSAASAEAAIEAEEVHETVAPIDQQPDVITQPELVASDLHAEEDMANEADVIASPDSQDAAMGGEDVQAPDQGKNEVGGCSAGPVPVGASGLLVLLLLLGCALRTVRGRRCAG